MCCTHTINLILKDIGNFKKVANVVASAKHICRFLYNHNRRHDEMRRMIGGELIRPNATRFGTVFMFLQSYMDKKDALRSWMVSQDWKESNWNKNNFYDYTEACLTNVRWWSSLKWAVDALRPLYLVLRYANSQRACTLSGFKLRMMATIHSMEAQLGKGTPQFLRFMSKVTKRVQAMETNTLMVAAAVLDPETHYTHNFSMNPQYALALTDAIEKMAQIHDDPVQASDDVVQAMKEITLFWEFHGRFDRPTARAGASSMTPTDWWLQFGGEVPTLQKYALRIVSRCVSSSGCERNWSKFALVHTKIRNRLGYDKLHKLVYVHYNLKERIKEVSGQQEKEVDPLSMMMETAIFDEENPIWDWLDKSMSDVGPNLASMYPSWLDSPAHGKNDRNKNGKRVREDDDRAREDGEIEFDFDVSEDEHEDEFEDALSEGDDDESVEELGCDVDDEDGDPIEPIPRVEEDVDVSRDEDHASRDGDHGRRSVRIRQKKLTVHSLYERE